MNNKTQGILVTIAAVVFCGLPGLLLGTFSMVRLVMDGGPGLSPTWLSLIPLAAAFVLMLVPVGVGIFAFRKKSNPLDS